MDCHHKPNSQQQEEANAYIDPLQHHEEATIDYVPGSEEERRLMQKIDMCLLPALWGMYLLSYMDRTKSVYPTPISQHGNIPSDPASANMSIVHTSSIGNAKIAGSKSTVFSCHS